MPINKRLIGLWIAIAAIGFADAVYLAVSHYRGDIACSVLKGCDTVLTSSYATVGPVPVAVLGVVYYLMMLLGMVLVLDRKNIQIARGLAWFSITGLVASIWFLYVQLQIISALCQYCLLSALTSTLLFVLGMVLVQKVKKSE